MRRVTTSLIFTFVFFGSALALASTSKAHLLIRTVLGDGPVAIDSSKHDGAIENLQNNPADISVAQFVRELSRRNLNYQITLPGWLEVRAAHSSVVRQFMEMNPLDRRTPTYQASLRPLEGNLSKILFLVELQTRLAKRSDLKIFGAQTVLNLNAAVQELVEIIYRQAGGCFRLAIGTTEKRAKIVFLNFENSLIYLGGSPVAPLGGQSELVLSRFIRKNNAAIHSNYGGFLGSCRRILRQMRSAFGRS